MINHVLEKALSEHSMAMDYIKISGTVRHTQYWHGVADGISNALLLLNLIDDEKNIELRNASLQAASMK